MTGYVDNLEQKTEGNAFFREVIFTGQHTQLVVMCLQVGEDIGMEVHSNVDQFFRIETGSGMVVMNGEETVFGTGFGIVVPAGTQHNIVNTGVEPLKLYTLYSPPNHPDGTIHKTKAEAVAAEAAHQE